MAIDYDAANAHIQNTLGGEMSPDLDDLSLMDQAGHFMCALYPWKHLERTTAALGALTTSGSFAIAASGEKAPYITALLGYTPRGTDSRVSGERAYLVTPEELLDLREGAADPDGAASGAVLDTGDTDSLNYFAVQYSSASPPVVELDCLCDTTNEITTVVLRYRKGWTPAATGAAFEMSVWMEPVYISCLRAFARGYEEEDVASLNMRLAEIRNGALVAAAIERDARMAQTKRHRIGPQQNWQVPGVHAAGQIRS